MPETTQPKEASSPSLQFKPLSAGLGFHPFSDGLPYQSSAPLPQIKEPPEFRKERVQTPASIATRPSRSAGPQLPSPKLKAPQLRPLTRAESEPLPYGRHYLLKRTLAFVFDFVFQSGLFIGLLLIATRKSPIQLEMLQHPSVLFVVILFAAVLHWSLLTFQEVVFKTSLGKKWMGLTLETSRGAIFVRSFFFAPSFLLFGLGCLWILIDSRKRGWHDWIADCQPLPRSEDPRADKGLE